MDVVRASFRSHPNLIPGAVLIALVIVLMSYQAMFPWSREKTVLYQDYHKHFLVSACNMTVDKHLQQLASKAHVAGTPQNFKTADYVLSVFRSYGLDAHYKDYRVLLTYPLDKSLSLSFGDGHMVRLDLREGRETAAIPAFHAYSPSGSVAAKVVYVNYGRVEDFIRAAHMGVDLKGAIVMARYGMIYRGDIVQNAADAGAVGVVLYSDPLDYGGNGTGGYYPQSKWLPPRGVQGGSVIQGIGDPLTPGWPSTVDAERLSIEDIKSSDTHTLPSVPSVPISAENAHKIMNYLGGLVAPLEWHGALGLPNYHIGPGPLTLNLTYLANQTMTPIRNVFAVIRGFQEPDRYVLLGNHRDAWSFGAVDPSSGTAALLELSGRFGKLLKRGWRPRRTIILCSWDAEEYGMIGSTEWVEENSDLLKTQAVAYINVDCAVAGSGFFASTTPQLDQLLIQATKLVKDPDNSSQSLYESWVANNDKNVPLIERLGGGSDHVPFVQRIGVPAADIYFGKDYPVYHSIYDDFLWMSKFGDPLFQRHLAVASVWGLVALKLADEEILPFSYDEYASELEKYTKLLERQLRVENTPPEISAAPLHHSLAKLNNAVRQITQDQKDLRGDGSRLHEQKALNDRLHMAERAFQDSYRHLIYGHSEHNDYGWACFPAISDSLKKATASNTGGDWRDVQHQIWRVSRAITRAALVLTGLLS